MEDPSCRICYEPAKEGNPLWQPCNCAGSLAYIHRRCLLRWIIEDGRVRERECHLCQAPYRVDAIQSIEAIPGPHNPLDFLLRTPLVLLVGSHYYVAFLLWMVPPDDRDSALSQIITIGHQAVHVFYTLLFASSARTNNFWRYMSIWGQEWYWVAMVHHALVTLYRQGFHEAGYAADLWLAVYWYAHRQILEKINGALLGS
jgi:hypothetical protein